MHHPMHCHSGKVLVQTAAAGSDSPGDDYQQNGNNKAVRVCLTLA